MQPRQCVRTGGPACGAHVHSSNTSPVTVRPEEEDGRVLDSLLLNDNLAAWLKWQAGATGGGVTPLAV